MNDPHYNDAYLKDVANLFGLQIFAVILINSLTSSVPIGLQCKSVYWFLCDENIDC